jgi:uncharacterized membrane protein YqjE
MNKWKNRLGTIRVVALVLVLAVIGIIWLVRH